VILSTLGRATTCTDAASGSVRVVAESDSPSFCNSPCVMVKPQLESRLAQTNFCALIHPRLLDNGMPVLDTPLRAPIQSSDCPRQ